MIKKNLILIISAVLFSLTLCEIVLRLLGIGYNYNPTNSSKTHHHKLVKNSYFTSYSHLNEWINVDVFTDKDGYRINPNKKIYKDNLNKIAFLGDSFTLATQVDYNKSYVGLLENYFPNFYLKNFGNNSYSPIIYLVQILNDLKEFKPTHVIIQIYANDIDNDNNYFKYADVNDANKLKYVKGGEKNTIISLYRYSYLLRFIRKSYLSFVYKEIKENDVVAEREFQFNNLNNSNNLTHKIIKRINNLSKVHNFKLYYFYIPYKGYIKNNSCCDKVYNYQVLKKFIGKEKFIDISKYISKNTNKIFFKSDLHMNDLGHKFIAEAIKDRLVKDLNK